MKLKKVLMVVHEFPPLGGPGSIRYLQFAKNLPQFGWEPYILTIRNPSVLRKRDNSLKVPKSLKLFKSITFPSFTLQRIISHFIKVHTDLFFIPDGSIGWIPATILKGLYLIWKEKIDLIFVGCSPFSASLTGYLLKKLTRKPLIIDFRDPFAENPTGKSRKRLLKYLDKKIEFKVLQIADKAVTVTPSCIKYFPHKEKFVVIYNGYFGLSQNKEKLGKKYDKFTITSVGSVYNGAAWKNFMKALKIFQEKKDGKPLQFIFIGNIGKIIQDQINRFATKFNIADVFEYKGYVPNDECNIIVQKSNLLVIILPPDKNIALAVKIFSYIHSDSPILGIMDSKGETAKFIEKSNIGIVVKNEVNEIVKGLIKLSNQVTFDKNWDYIKLFDRRNLTRTLGNLFNEVAGKGEEND